MAPQLQFLYYFVMTQATPLIALANYFQFARGQRVAYPYVHSRMLLWCKAGQGTVQVNRDLAPFERGDILLTPWRHAIVYHADASDPFFVAGIHIIPHQARGAPLVRAVDHTADPPAPLAAGRADAPWPGLVGLRRGHWTGDEPLPALADYTVRRLQQEPPEVTELRTLAALLIEELRRFFTRPQAPRRGLPIDLQRAMQFIDDHLAQAIYLGQVAQMANRSLAWLHREFRASLGTTPMQYLIAARIRKAMDLLSTSSLNVSEVGQAVGIDDPYYFSKRFKQQTGVSPRLYRRRASLL